MTKKKQTGKIRSQERRKNQENIQKALFGAKTVESEMFWTSKGNAVSPDYLVIKRTGMDLTYL